MRAERDEVRRIPNRRKFGPAEQFNRRCSFECGQIEPGVLNKAREVGNDEDHFVLIAADECQNVVIVRIKELERPAAKRFVTLPQGDEPFHPPQHRVRIVLLRLHIERFVMRIRVDNNRQIQAVGAGSGKAGVSIRAPLHWGSNTVPVAEINVVAHADFVAVVDDRRTGKREQKRVHQFDLVPVLAQQRC